MAACGHSKWLGREQISGSQLTRKRVCVAGGTGRSAGAFSLGRLLPTFVMHKGNLWVYQEQAGQKVLYQ